MKEVCVFLILATFNIQDGFSAKLPTSSKFPFPSSTFPYSKPSPDMSNMARIKSLDVKCGRTAMNVDISFTANFPGVIYSKGHFSDPSCVYVKPKDARSDVYRFTIPLDGCGTQEEEEQKTSQYFNRDANGRPASGIDRVIGNTIIVQSDPVIQEVWDEARHITCSWTQSLVKSVNFKPIKVYEPRTVDVQLDSRAVNTLMEIQREARDGTADGSSHLASPPTGYVHVGDEVSLVMYVRGSRMDANVVSCEATRERKGYSGGGGGDGVELVDGRGCLLRPDLLTPFAKTTQTNGVEADLMLYSYLKNFNIQEVPEFTISCELELCENVCPKPCVGGNNRRRRSDQMVVRVDLGMRSD